jgi:hypothetical protein
MYPIQLFEFNRYMVDSYRTDGIRGWEYAEASLGVTTVQARTYKSIPEQPPALHSQSLKSRKATAIDAENCFLTYKKAFHLKYN